MIKNLFTKIFGSRNERIIKQLRVKVEEVNALEEQMRALSDEELSGQTDKLRQQIQDGKELDSLIPEAFATVREAGKRILNMRHFDEQLIGGMVLNSGKISEMKTGEGKTLVATLAVYLNALSGKGVHVITVNDYLAKRDGAWMGKLYHSLGMSIGIIQSSGAGGDSDSFVYDPEQKDSVRSAERKEAYAADITYGTNNEFGFDYLRDNMSFSADERVQRGQHYAVIDEVDSILIDEARTPLIISGPAEDSSTLYAKIDKLIPKLERQQHKPEDKEDEGDGHYAVDEKHKTVTLTEAGHQAAEEMLTEEGLLAEGESLYSASNITLLTHLNAGLRAHALYQRDVHYLIQDGQIVIVDEFTGRTMPGRRWSEGLHQAVEAKEGLVIQQENQTLASITFQNYFRLYEKLSGMTGTADTEAYEFQQIYNLEVIVIPTHRPMLREDNSDLVYLSVDEKYGAIIEDILDCHERKQPVLVGTTSIENSEQLAAVLKKSKIKYNVLNAKNHENEAHIVANAGRPGAVTIATNMAGRGTDIVLGGSLDAELSELKKPTEQQEQEIKDNWQKRHDEVLAAGGLHIIGTERHESRRVDNQLRGRSGRQGDPGSTRFYLSLEDPLMRIFASEKMAGLMQKLGMEEGEAIEHPWVNKAIANAQRKVEGHNFDIRKQLLEYDDVANDQRKVVYEQRNELMDEEDISEFITGMRVDVIHAIIDEYIPPQSIEEQWEVSGAEDAIESEFGVKLPIANWLEEDENLHEETLRDKVVEEIVAGYAAKEELAGSEAIRHFEKAVMLQVLDSQWKEHLAAMDHLRQGIHLRGYAQKNPKQEYKREAFEMFSAMLDRIKRETIGVISRVEIQDPADVATVEEQRQPAPNMSFSHESADSALSNAPAAEGQDKPFVREGRKVGRNEPCPCGSGKKYKQCCGKL